MNSNKQILTGQIKPTSLNTIYNRVSYLKSKNVSRRLIQRQQQSLNQQNNQQNYISLQTINPKQIAQISKFSINDNVKINDKSFHELFNSKFSYIKSSNNKNRKLVQIKQTDNEETNFWASQKYIQNAPPINKQKNLSSSKISIIKDQNNVNQKIDKDTLNNTFIRNKSNYNNNKKNNRAYLISNFQKISNFPSQTLNNGQKPSIQENKNSSLSNNKRPFTSSFSRGKIKFRVNQLSKNQIFKSKLKQKQQQRKINNLSQNKQKQNKISQSKVSLSLLKGEERQLIYQKQIGKFQKLYQFLSEVLSSIKEGLFQVEKSISDYANFIQNKNISFIDDFMTNKEIKIQKFVRTSRLHETLSICYLFLQIAQGRINDNQSYLVNFIGHSLSNLLLIVRLYMIKQSRIQFHQSQFEKSLDQLQLTTYGQKLYSIDDILLRIQHNNQIITMIHKRLGRSNQKFQSCIKSFLKNAQRNKYSCSLCAHYIFEYLSMHIHQVELLNISPSLQVAPKPYTPPAQKQYTLIIEPLGILQKNGKFRPYLNQFIKWASKNFDIILWTWQLPYAVQQIYEALSPYLVSRLYRHHCKIQNNIYVKDLLRLGRNLQNTIIIDFDKRIFSQHMNNGLQCRWKGNQNDKNLLVLSQILQQMINSKTNVSDTLTFYSQQLFSIRGY